jgi:hypothetical protein
VTPRALAVLRSGDDTVASRMTIRLGRAVALHLKAGWIGQQCSGLAAASCAVLCPHGSARLAPPRARATSPARTPILFNLRTSRSWSRSKTQTVTPPHERAAYTSASPLSISIALLSAISEILDRFPPWRTSNHVHWRSSFQATVMLYRHEIISLHVHQDRGGDYMHHLHRLLSGHIGLDYQPCTVATTVGSHADADARPTKPRWRPGQQRRGLVRPHLHVNLASPWRWLSIHHLLLHIPRHSFRHWPMAIAISGRWVDWSKD